MKPGDKFDAWLPTGRSIARKKESQIFSFRYKTTYGILELYRNNDMIYPIDDNKTLGQTDGRDRIVNPSMRSFIRIASILFQAITIRWVQHPTQTGSSGESSSSDSEINNNNNNVFSSHHTRVLDSIDINAESTLPSVVRNANLPIECLFSCSRYSPLNTNITNFWSKYPI